MPQLDLSTFPAQIFWLLFSFLSLFLLVRYIIVPRMHQIFDARWEKQDNNLQRANEFKAEADQLLFKTEQLIEKSKEEASQLIKQCELEIKAEQERILEELQQTLHQKIAQAEKDMQIIKQKIIEDLPSFSSDLARSSMIHFDYQEKKAKVKKNAE
jgi:F-type H+-transporting ATPase subunit b